MPRGRPKSLGLSESEIEERRQRLYEFLPEELREDFLEIVAASRGGESLERLKELRAQKAEKKAVALEERVVLIDRAIEGLKAHRKVLVGLTRDLRRGGDPGMVDLRQELKAPPVEGVMIRYLRSGTDGSGESGSEGESHEGSMTDSDETEATSENGIDHGERVLAGRKRTGTVLKAGTGRRRGRPKKMGFEEAAALGNGSSDEDGTIETSEGSESSESESNEHAQEQVESGE